MFCPKCGTKNPETGKFCRKCGTGLAVVSEALSGEGDLGGANFASATDPTGLSISLGDMDSNGKKRRTPDDLWASGIKSSIGGLGFLVIAAVLFLTNVANGQRWWWAMLFPAFSMIAGGIGNIAKANRMEKRMSGNQGGTQNAFPEASQNTALPPKQTEFVSPDSTNYKTGDLVPASVVEKTTRHLEMDSEGETMTLKKK